MISDDQLRRVLPASMVALTGDLIRALAWALVLVVWVAFAQVYIRMIRLTLTDPAHSDFTIFYYTARMVADGLPMYGVSPTHYGVTWAAEHLGNLNPPHLQLLFLPLARFSYGQALIVFVAASAACLTCSLWLVKRELEIPWSWRRFWLWGAFTVSCAAFTTVAVTSELTFVLMVPFTLAWSAWRRGKWMAAGAWLGACASIKLFLLLFVPVLLFQRRWRPVIAFVGSAMALCALGVLIFGVEAYRQWMTTLGRVGWWWLPMNGSWHGFVSRVLEGGRSVTPVVDASSLVRPVALVGGALIAIGTIRIAGSRELTARDPDRSMLVALIGAILASPLGWVYYLPLAYGPLVGWLATEWHRIRRRGWWQGALLIGGIALLYVPQEVAAAGQPSALATITLASVYFWSLLMLWVLLTTARA